MRHTLDGESFLAVYGHIETDLAEGQIVEPDRPVGRIGRFFNGTGARADHLHFAIHPGCCPVIDGKQNGWGRKADVGCVAILKQERVSMSSDFGFQQLVEAGPS